MACVACGPFGCLRYGICLPLFSSASFLVLFSSLLDLAEMLRKPVQPIYPISLPTTNQPSSSVSHHRSKGNGPPSRARSKLNPKVDALLLLLCNSKEAVIVVCALCFHPPTPTRRAGTKNFTYVCVCACVSEAEVLGFCGEFSRGAYDTQGPPPSC